MEFEGSFTIMSFNIEYGGSLFQPDCIDPTPYLHIITSKNVDVVAFQESMEKCTVIIDDRSKRCVEVFARNRCNTSGSTEITISLLASYSNMYFGCVEISDFCRVSKTVSFSGGSDDAYWKESENCEYALYGLTMYALLDERIRI